MSNQDKRNMRWAVRFKTQSGLCYKPSGAKKMKPISHLRSLVFWKESGLHPAAHSTSCKPYSEGMCGHAPSPRQTAACLSQVIFVKQLLLSHFFSSRNYHHYTASDTKQPIWAKDISYGCSQIPKMCPEALLAAKWILLNLVNRVWLTEFSQ